MLMSYVECSNEYLEDELSESKESTIWKPRWYRNEVSLVGLDSTVAHKDYEEKTCGMTSWIFVLDIFWALLAILSFPAMSRCPNLL